MAKKPTTIRVEEDLMKQFREKVNDNGDNQSQLFESFIRTYIDGEIVLRTDKSRLKIGVISSQK